MYRSERVYPPQIAGQAAGVAPLMDSAGRTDVGGPALATIFGEQVANLRTTSDCAKGFRRFGTIRVQVGQNALHGL